MRLENYRCKCGLPAVCGYGDDTATEDGKFNIKYFCKEHGLERGKLQNLYFKECYENIVNEYGVTIMVKTGNWTPLYEFLNRHKSQEQTVLF